MFGNIFGCLCFLVFYSIHQTFCLLCFGAYVFRGVIVYTHVRVYIQASPFLIGFIMYTNDFVLFGLVLFKHVLFVKVCYVDVLDRMLTVSEDQLCG